MSKKTEPRVRETSVFLLDEELVLLDGKVREEVQDRVDGARQRIEAREMYPDLDHAKAGFIADVVRQAIKGGELVYRRTRLRVCSLCTRRPGYARRTRTSSKGFKGELDYSKPLYMDGYEFVHSFLQFKGYANLGCCSKCLDVIRDALVAALENIEAELPESLMGYPPKYLYFRKRKCKQCKWVGHEGEMGRLPTLLEDGTYPGVCPKCGNESWVFSSSAFETLDDGVVIPASELPALQEAARERRIQARARPKRPKAKRPKKRAAT